MEGIRTRQEACLLHSPSKWVDEDECMSFSEHNQNYSLIATEINNHLINEDKLNGNFNLSESAVDMVNEAVSRSELADSTSDLNREKPVSRAECEYLAYRTT